MLCTLLPVLYLSVTCHTPKWPPNVNRRRAPGVIRLGFNGYGTTVTDKDSCYELMPIYIHVFMIIRLSDWREFELNHTFLEISAVHVHQFKNKLCWFLKVTMYIETLTNLPKVLILVKFQILKWFSRWNIRNVCGIDITYKCSSHGSSEINSNNVCQKSSIVAKS